MSLVRRGDIEITKRYRPRRLSEIVGNKSTVKSMQKCIEMGSKRQGAYLLHGPAGTGKTTLARIMAMGLNCETGDTGEPCLVCEDCVDALLGGARASHIVELNLARCNKKEDAEEIVNGMSLSTLTGRNKVYIFDEAQMLTKQAQNLLLKNLEEPPPNTYIFICTTEPNKIIKAIRNRCEQYEFKLPTELEIKEVLADVFKQEPDWDLSVDDKIAFMNVIIGTSVRGVLKSIDKVVRGGIESLTFINDEEPELITICRCVVDGNWNNVVKELKKYDKENPLNAEGLRRCMLTYFRKMLLNANTDNKNIDKSVSIAEAMKAFKDPYFDADSAVPLVTVNLFEATLIMLSIKD